MPPKLASNRPGRRSAIFVGLVWAILSPSVQGDGPSPRRPDGWPDPAQVGRGEPARPAEVPAEAEPAEPAAEPAGEDEAKGEGTGEGEAKEAAKDGPLDPFFDLVDPARLQRELDKALGARFPRRRPRRELPEVPEIGEPVFFDLTRPLGARRYSNEINYLFNSSTRSAPTLQVIEYEYAFADWNAVELDLQFYDQILEVITPFYQRTLGVGCGGRSVYGIQVSPDVYRRSGFIGGSAVLAYGWKPTKESKFSTLSFVGVNRQLIGGFFTPNSARQRLGGMVQTGAATTAPEPIFGAWRPTFNFDVFYQLTETVSLGIENDLFFQSERRSSEYLSFPFVTWEAGQHAFFQVGAGYYHFEGRDQATFLVHLNFVNPSVKIREEDLKADQALRSGGEGTDDETVEPARSGPIRRWIGRRREGR